MAKIAVLCTCSYSNDNNRTNCGDGHIAVSVVNAAFISIGNMLSIVLLSTIVTSIVIMNIIITIVNICI